MHGLTQAKVLRSGSYIVQQAGTPLRRFGLFSPFFNLERLVDKRQFTGRCAVYPAVCNRQSQHDRTAGRCHKVEPGQRKYVE